MKVQLCNKDTLEFFVGDNIEGHFATIRIPFIASYCEVQFQEVADQKNLITFSSNTAREIVTFIETTTGTKYVFAGCYASEIRDCIRHSY